MNFKEAPKEYHIHIGMEDIESHLSKLDIDGQQGWRVPNALEIINLSSTYDVDSINKAYTFWYLKFDNTFGLVSTDRTVIPKEIDAILVPVIKIPETLVISPLIYHRDMITRDEAVMYCFTLDIDGDVGWRLPTREEVRYMKSFRVWEIANAEDVISSDDKPSSLNHYAIPVRDARPGDKHPVMSKEERSNCYNAYRYKLQAVERNFSSGQGRERLRRIIQSVS